MAGMGERRRQPQTMSDYERDMWVKELRRRGWAWKKIGQHVGLSENGAKYLHQRLTNPQKYYDEDEL